MARNCYHRPVSKKLSDALNVGLVVVLIIAFIVVTVGAIQEGNILKVAVLFTILGCAFSFGMQSLAKKLDEAAQNRKQARLVRFREEGGLH